MEPVSNADKLAEIRKWIRSSSNEIGFKRREALQNIEANAPEWIEILLLEIDEWRKVAEGYREEMGALAVKLQSIQQERDELIEERDYFRDNRSELFWQVQQDKKRLIRVLHHIETGTKDDVTKDYARSVLREIGVGEERT